MRNLLNPLWLLFINTLPALLIFIIFNENYQVIKSLLTEENIITWKNLGSALALLSILNLLYALILIILRKKVSFLYGILSLVGYITFLYIYFQQADKILPSDIPRWMMSDGILLYVATFLMPTLVYSLFILVIRFTEKKEKQNASRNFMYALMVPVCLYFFFQILVPLIISPLRGDNENSDAMIHAATIICIAATVIFLFFLMRGIYILSKKENKFFKENQLLWKIPVTVLFPIIGLSLNNGTILSFIFGGNSDEGIFGNFNNLWFSLVALVNGILLCLPEQANKRNRLLLYAGKCITFAYTLYFFFVFIPFLPLSVLAVLLLGVGFLMLAPLILTIVQINSINHDYNFLKRYYPSKALVAGGIVCFFVIPTCITCSFLQDKKTLNEALSYISAPDYTKEYSFSKRSLKSTLAELKSEDGGSLFGFGGSQTPFLSTWFNWLVLDNMKVSNQKALQLKTVFLGQEASAPDNSRFANEPDSVQISDIRTRSTYNTEKQFWTTWVDLKLTQQREDSWPISEYKTTFTLPIGCSISDYYLFVGDSLANGILAEKKAATWIYTQITTTSRDPGILYYSAPNTVTFKVFPFRQSETRKTGIQFIHKNPVTIELDGQTIQLGDSAAQHVESAVNNNFICYLPSAEKEKLPLVKRTPYYHFLVDISEGKQTDTNRYINDIKKVMQNKAISPDNARISFVNSYVHTYPMDGDWEQLLKKQSFEGGFFLERGIRKALFTTYKEQKAIYPLLIAITDSLNNMFAETNFSDMQPAYPENNFFYAYTLADSLEVHSLSSQPYKVCAGKNTFQTENKVYAWPDATAPKAWLRADNQAAVILKDSVDNLTMPFEKDWLSALRLQGISIAHAFYPQTVPSTWLSEVKHSFESGILTPFTSYIVLETESQRALLKQKQEKVLSGNPLLDLEEDTRQMTEPDILWVALLAITCSLFSKKTRNKYFKTNPIRAYTVKLWTKLK